MPIGIPELCRGASESVCCWSEHRRGCRHLLWTVPQHLLRSPRGHVGQPRHATV